MKKPLAALLLEDHEDDAMLVLRELRHQGYDVTWERVWTAEDTKAKLEARPWDVVLSDYNMPNFDAPAALQILRGTGQDLPFIVLSGTIGESAAVALMKTGAHDYLMKGHLARLGAVIEREIGDAKVRRANRHAQEKILHLNRVLRAIRNVNQLIIQEKDPTRLTKRACDLLIETRGYTDVLLVQTTVDLEPDLIAHSPAVGGGTDSVGETIRRTGLTKCMNECLASGAPFVVTEDRPDCRTCPLHRLHSGRHRLACALIHEGKRYGAISAALPQGVLLDDDELELFAEVVNDLSFALHTIELVTQRQQAEIALKQSEHWHRLLFEKSRDALLTLTPPEWRYTTANRATVELFGAVDEADFVARDPDEFSPPLQPDGTSSDEKSRRMIDVAVRVGSHFFEWTHRRLSGEEFPATVLFTRVDFDGEVVLQATVRDETKTRILQASVAQSDRLATMGMLAAGVAHEINNPLSYVTYNLESLAQDMPELASTLRESLRLASEAVGPEAWQRLLAQVPRPLDLSVFDDIQERLSDALQGTHRIKDIARGLRIFSRVEQDDKVAVALTPIIEIAIDMAFNEIKYRALLVKDFGETSPVLANDGRLSQVFLNLLINAAHAIQDGDVEHNLVSVRTWQEGDEACVEVRDSGRGIPKENFPRLFEPFFTTKAAGVGTGLGLSISKSIVEDYGGRIQVESKVGEGTRFVVRLPVMKSAPAVEIVREAPEARQAESFGHVLIIDDENGIRAAMVRMLKGHNVVSVASGEEAKRVLEADTSFDVVICDVMMPAMSGVELHEWLVHREPELARRVVFVTGGAFTPKAREYLASVSNRHLEKPFGVKVFRALVSELVEARRAAARGGR